MQVTIDLPEDGDFSRRALEALAVEGYRTGALSETQVKTLLGFKTRLQVHTLCLRSSAPPTDLLLIDDAEGRAEARRLHLRVTGTLGVLKGAAELD
jgi:hypothetical protein